ncbi:MAG: tetratricopeptide repeat protein [Bryobacteraceae bacterium]
MTIWPVLFLVSTCDPAPALEGKRLFDQGRFAEAEVRFRSALKESCDAGQRLADRINLAATLRERNAAAEAREVLLAATDIAQMPMETQISYWNCLALVEEHAGRPAQSEAAYRKAVALLTPSTPPRLAMQIWTNVARHRMKEGCLREAEEALQAPGWQHDRPLSFHLNLAELRRMQGRPREAEDILRTLLRDRLSMPAQIQGAIANNLASLAAGRGENREAERLWRAANRALRDAYGASHPIVAKSLNNLAAHYVSRKRYAEAETLYREAIAMREDPLLLNNLAALLHQRRRTAEAEELYRRALDKFEKPSREAMQPHGNLAVLLADTGRIDEALAQFQKVVQLLPLAVPADEPAAGRYLERYESILRRCRESAEAERIAAMAMRYRVRSALRAED